ncbi:MAG TPA: sigma-70 family RNA polymerase sigma factor [Acidimicrobiia bacterium]|nr:sigma-70 family RNA polymerase sigma factor [Acidimicrobiia bacterium]
MGNPADPSQVEREKERELITRAQKGDRAAFAALVRANQDEVYTLARRLVGDPHLASDVAQEALIRAWQALPKFRGDAKLSTWLHRITVNTAWTHKQRARRHRSTPIDDYREVAAPMGADHPEVAGETLELRGRLRAVLDRLPDSQREVVVLKDIYGWSHAEIAESMGISTTAAKVRLHRARARLAKDLEETA